MSQQPVSTSAKQIANKALVLLGSARRMNAFETGDNADTDDLVALWDIARRSAIVLHPFNFALTRASLDRDAGAAATRGPAYSFTLPSDCLRWLPWSREDELWFDAVEEGGNLLSSDDGPLIVRYLRDVTDVSRWPPLFCDVMVHTLAVEYCQAKTQLLGLRDRLTSERAELLSDAKRVDGLASPNRRATPSVRNSGWAGARFRPNGGSSWRW